MCSQLLNVFASNYSKCFPICILVQYFGGLQNIMEQNMKIREDMQLCNRDQKDISKLVGCKMIAGSCMLTIY